jgi:hypothetical protein
MEKYYERLDEEYQDRDLAIEEIFYESDLRYTFALEGDPPSSPSGSTGGTTGGTSSTGGGGNATVKKVTNQLDGAENNVNRVENNAQAADQQKTQNQAAGKDNPKLKEEVVNTAKQIAAKVTQFIREHLANLGASMSQMLNDNADTAAELDRIMRTRKLDDNIVVTDYQYNDNFISDFSKALTATVTDYANACNANKAKIDEAIKLASEGNMNEATKTATTVEVDANGNPESTTKTTNVNEAAEDATTENPPADSSTNDVNAIKITSPAEIMMGKLHIDAKNIGDANATSVKKYCYAQIKGTSADDNKPKKVLLKNNMAMLDNAKSFIRDYKNYLKFANTARDGIKNAFTSFEDICKKVEGIQNVNEELQKSINKVFVGTSKGLNECTAFIDFYITILKERAISCELLIRYAYNAPKALTADKGKNANQKNNQTQEGQGNAT